LCSLYYYHSISCFLCTFFKQLTFKILPQRHRDTKFFTLMRICGIIINSVLLEYHPAHPDACHLSFTALINSRSAATLLCASVPQWQKIGCLPVRSRQAAMLRSETHVQHRRDAYATLKNQHYAPSCAPIFMKFHSKQDACSTPILPAIQ